MQRLVFVGQNGQHEVALPLFAINGRLLWLIVVVELLNITSLMVVNIRYRRALGKLACDDDVILDKSVFFKLWSSLNISWYFICVYSPTFDDWL